MNELKEYIKQYTEELEKFEKLDRGCAFNGSIRPLVLSNMTVIKNFIRVLKDVQNRIQKTETPDSVLLDKLQVLVEGWDDILFQHDYEDGFFLSKQDRTRFSSPGNVLDKDTSAKRLNLRDAIQAAIDFKQR